MRAIAFLVSFILLLPGSNMKAFSRTALTDTHFAASLAISKQNTDKSYRSSVKNIDGFSSSIAVNDKCYSLPTPLIAINSKLLKVTNPAVNRLFFRSTPVWAEPSAFSSEDAEDDNRNGFFGIKHLNQALNDLNPHYHFKVNFFQSETTHAASAINYQSSPVYIFHRNLRI